MCRSHEVVPHADGVFVSGAFVSCSSRSPEAVDRDRAVLVGCTYIDPPERVGADAEISWWVIDDLVGGTYEAALDDFIPNWISSEWPLAAPRYVGIDLSWSEWLALPELG